MANGGTEDQDQDAYDALMQTQEFQVKLKKKQCQTMKKYAELQKPTIL